MPECRNYDASYFADHDIKVITVHMGYVDGLSQQLQNSLEIIIHEKRAKSVCDFCMDMAMFHTTGINCKEGDILTILGTDGNEKISLHNWSNLCPSSSTFLKSMLRNNQKNIIKKGANAPFFHYTIYF